MALLPRFRALLIVVALVFVNQVHAQQDSFPVWEVRLANWGQILLGEFPDEEKVLADSNFKHLLIRMVETGQAWDYPFARVVSLAKIQPEDERFRLLNWMVARADGTSYHHCIWINEPRADGPKWIDFEDVSDQTDDPRNAYLNKGTFLGALYYQVVTTGKGDDKTYTLLGYDRHSAGSHRKVIEPLVIDSKGTPRFGARIFKLPKTWQDRPVQGKPYRLYLEYSIRFTASVRYLESEKMIVLDHTAPLNPQAKGVYADYSPDFSYDALRWKQGKWVFEEQVVFNSRQNNPIKPPDKPVGPPKSR
jgi:hypothetical protein